jgi:BirA family biotin operon repressor/biotin-[acetyl-CoA-carboxylase] ligase
MTLFDLPRLRSESFVRHVEHHAELASTNTRALELTEREEYELPVLVLCDHQMEGRGRGSNRWWSGEGALTFSLLIDAARWNLPADRHPRVSLATGVAVCEAVQATLPANSVGLKWPNDVHLDGRKACGILVETPPRSGRLVVGVGLNVNNSLADAPDEVRARATSLADAAGVSFEPTEVLLAVLRQIERNLHLLATDEAALAEKWSALSVLTGRSVELTLGSRSVRGRCLGISQDGALLLNAAAGQERFYAGVVARFD